VHGIDGFGGEPFNMSHGPQDHPSLWDFIGATWKDHALVYAVSTWSGMVSHLHRIWSCRTPFSLVAFLADVLLAGLAGVMVFWMGYELQLSPITVALSAGIAGHSAPRTIWLIEKRFFRSAGLDDERDPRL
jgi:hypothetical protein